MHSKLIPCILVTAALGLPGAGVAAAAALGADRAFTARVTNPYYPLLPGMRWEYRGVKDGRPLRDVVLVSGRIERVAGVHLRRGDRSRLRRRPASRSRTVDWFAQDGEGTVWYFGEATRELDRQGRVTSTEGSWRAGVDGARQGIFMPARPQVGQSFAQEHYPGHAEDHFKVVGRTATIARPVRDLQGPRADDARNGRRWSPACATRSGTSRASAR